MLVDKVALITGAAQGIGKATAVTLAKEGADVVATDVDTIGVKQTAKEIEQIGRKALAITLDVRSKEQVRKAIQQAVQQFKRIDILVNCAGISTSSLIINTPEEEWDRVMDINTKGVFLMSQAVAKEMIKNHSKGKRIINISSQASKMGEIGNGAYCASKAAVNLLTQVLALELAPYNVNATAICPGYTDTAIMEQVFEKRGPIEGMTPEQYKENLLSDVPLKRMAQPEEIANLVAFLASDKAEYITGVAITISGGKTLS